MIRLPSSKIWVMPSLRPRIPLFAMVDSGEETLGRIRSCAHANAPLGFPGGARSRLCRAVPPDRRPARASVDVAPRPRPGAAARRVAKCGPKEPGDVSNPGRGPPYRLSAREVGLEPVERGPRVALAVRRHRAEGMAGRGDPTGDEDAVAIRDHGEFVRQEIVEQCLAPAAAEGIRRVLQDLAVQHEVMDESWIVEVLAADAPVHIAPGDREFVDLLPVRHV